MWGGKINLNQCQDCGCPGAQLIIDLLEDNWMRVRCPYCGRKGMRFNLSRIYPEVAPELLIETSWNSYNTDNKEGLA